ncbi:MAG: gamma-glutamyltransferase family protein [Xanthobacteraceae bacterium]|nr:gamma-glutamyltransferase family protein [Xanthobacteraceae bacterium]
MLRSVRAPRGMVTAPHQLATQTGLSVLQEGGNAIEAMVAAAATIAVVYPHMNAIGGDGFWIIHVPGREPVAIMACGAAGAQVNCDFYRRQNLDAIPARGPLGANTVAGTIGGWAQALEISASIGGKIALARLLGDAIDYARDGFPVSHSQSVLTAAKLGDLKGVSGFSDAFAPGGAVPKTGDIFKQPRLAATLQQLASDGVDSFYRGELSRRIARDLERAGSPITAADLNAYRARQERPHRLSTSQGDVYNVGPPTQGISSLTILGVFERLGVKKPNGFDHVHGLVEATKQAFIVRNREIADRAAMTIDPSILLSNEQLDVLAKRVDPRQALPWPVPSKQGDTIWMGAIDQNGVAVSFIQSVYWEFGSGVVLEDTGIVWQNRGYSFSLDPNAVNGLKPGKFPFHTLNPALALLTDGRTMVYGTMGGEGQPQTQAALFTRHVLFGQDIQAAITAPRWLLGRTWGAESTTLKLESRFDPNLVASLKKAGHNVEMIGEFDEVVGHAGAVIRHADRMFEGATDPRSDGAAAGY